MKALSRTLIALAVALACFAPLPSATAASAGSPRQELDADAGMEILPG
jgi:hypothetical protein